MALVAYSDESDFSEEEDTNGSLNPLSSPKSIFGDKIVPDKTHENKALPTSAPNGLLGIDPIETDDDDDNFATPAPRDNFKGEGSSKLLAGLPPISSARASSAELATQDADQLIDVPTKETWQPSREALLSKDIGKRPEATASTVRAETASGSAAGGGRSGGGVAAAGLSKAQQMALSSSALASLIVEKRTKGGKIQLQLPPMTEFAENDDDEDTGRVADAADVGKAKRGPSNAGTGLFSLLPKPKNATRGKESKRSLVPHVLSKPPTKNQTVRKKCHPGLSNKIGSKIAAGAKVASKSGLADDESSDDDEESSTDFFSLDSNHSVVAPVDEVSISSDSSLISNESTGASERLLSISPATSSFSNSSLSSNNYQPSDTCVVRPEQPIQSEVQDHIPLPNLSSNIEAENSLDQLDPRLMDDEAWRRLTGKKRKAQDIDIIDFNPDDALLSRDELMNQVISQQKPNQSHSKKKGNLPSQQQKRKHQITYLAHQAKEREIELQNEWSTGKAKKMQTRAKYGF